MLIIANILSRVSFVVQTEVDAEIARKLNVTPQTLLGWRKRGTIPWPELFDFSKKHDLSFDWLLTGKQIESGRQPQEDSSVDTITELKYKPDHIPTHAEVEFILNSGDTDAVNALKYGIKGVIKTLEERSETVNLLRQNTQLLRDLTVGQGEMVGLLRESFAVIAEPGVPVIADTKRGVRKKKAV